MTTMNEIEAACKAARLARDSVHQRAIMLSAEIDALKRKHLPHLRRGVERMADADAAVLALLQQAPDLFDRPRSQVFHGLKVGFKKGTGKLEIADAERVVALVKKHFPDQLASLVKTTEKPVKSALQELSVADLKKLGITVEETGDVVFLKDAVDGVDKLVAGLLKGAEAEQEEAEAEA